MDSLNLKDNLKLEAFTYVSNSTVPQEVMIFYNDNCSENNIMFNILHEFAHLILSHKAYNNVVGNSAIPEKLANQEKEANEFACEVLAPSCVFKTLNIYNFEELKSFSNLPLNHIDEHISNITNFNNFDDISQRIISIFNSYIEQTKKTLSTKSSANHKENFVEQSKSEEIKRELEQQLSLQKSLIAENIRLLNAAEETKRLKKSNKLIAIICGTVGVAVAVTALALNINSNKTKPIVPQQSIVSESTTIQPNKDYISKKTGNIVPLSSTVYLTKTGKSFHLDLDCSYIKGKSNLTETTIEQVKDEYSPCSLCFK